MVYSVRTHGQLLELSSPQVMAIINITPDSFYTSCFSMLEQDILAQVQFSIDQGADIIDLGACSTRPGSTPVTPEEELNRLSLALPAIRHHWPKIVISVDTFRADIAQYALSHGADIINDVYGGEADPEMWNVIAKNHAPYILTHSQPIPPSTGTYDMTLSYLLHYLQHRLDMLHRMGIADVIVDPGFGFGKTQQQNYAILAQLSVLEHLHAPILVGLSRKSMLYQALQTTPEEVLPATVAANTIALQHGANILRVHDVKAAKQAIEIYQLTR